MDDIILYPCSGDILKDASSIIESAQRYAFKAVDRTLVIRNWLLGKRIAEEELGGEGRAEYGRKTIASLSVFLSEKYGKGYDRASLYRYLNFYQMYPKIVATVRRQSQDNSDDEIVATAWRQLANLTWSHYRILIQVNDPIARSWYEKEACEQNWSVRTLQRNISTQYYYRMLKTQDPAGVEAEMKEHAAPLQDKLEFIRNPVIAEFLGMQQDTKYYESDLEQAIISNLQKFLMELGKGYAFVARQQHIHTEKEDYFIDLVFYNYILKCFVLIDLKTSKITHQDVGQMDMYIRMYDELKKRSDDNPTLGIVLCADTDEDIAKYSVLHGNEQLFASKYKLFLPSEEQLRAEIETQKRFFLLQQAEQKKDI